jgi:hypothetical protein
MRYRVTVNSFLADDGFTALNQGTDRRIGEFDVVSVILGLPRPSMQDSAAMTRSSGRRQPHLQPDRPDHRRDDKRDMMM